MMRALQHGYIYRLLKNKGEGEGDTFEVRLWLSGSASVLTRCSSEEEAMKRYEMAIRILKPALHDPFLHRAGDEKTLQSSVRIRRYDNRIAVFDKTASSIGNERQVAKSPSESMIAAGVDSPVKKICASSRTEQSHPSMREGVTTDLQTDLTQNRSHIDEMSRRKIALKTIAAPRLLNRGGRIVAPRLPHRGGRKRRRPVLLEESLPERPSHGKERSGRRRRKLDVAETVSKSGTSPKTIDFKLDNFASLDSVHPRSEAFSKKHYQDKDSNYGKEFDNKSMSSSSCAAGSFGSIDCGSLVDPDPEDVETKWPTTNRICCLCGGDDASAARMLGSCWDAKSLSDEVCCDYDGQVHMNTRIRLEAIRPLLLTSTFQLLSNSIHLHFLSISMGAYVLQGPMDATSFGCC